MDNLNIFSITFLVFLVLGSCNGGELRKNFYRISCPEAENIVRSFTWKHVASKNSLPAKLIRMHFHDCFVRVRKNLISEVLEEVLLIASCSSRIYSENLVYLSNNRACSVVL